MNEIFVRSLVTKIELGFAKTLSPILARSETVKKKWREMKMCVSGEERCTLRNQKFGGAIIKLSPGREERRRVF